MRSASGWLGGRRERASIARKVGDWAREIEVWSPIFRTADATHRIRLDLARPY